MGPDIPANWALYANGILLAVCAFFLIRLFQKIDETSSSVQELHTDLKIVNVRITDLQKDLTKTQNDIDTLYGRSTAVMTKLAELAAYAKLVQKWDIDQFKGETHVKDPGHG